MAMVRRRTDRAMQASNTAEKPNNASFSRNAERPALIAITLLLLCATGYNVHLHQERAKSDRVAEHFEIAQKSLIDDRDYFIARTLTLEANFEQSEARVEHIATLLEDRQKNLEKTILQLTEGSLSIEASDEQPKTVSADLEQILIENKNLEAENARLRVRATELADALAQNQALIRTTATDLGSQNDET